MLDEETIVLDRVAKGLDLVCDLGLVLEGGIDCQVTLVVA